MKNNLNFIVILFFLNLTVSAYSNSYTFDVNKIELLSEGNKIIATQGTAISKDKNFKISSDKFIYIKDLDLLESIGNGKLIIKSKNLRINYENAIFDKINSTIKINGDVQILLPNDYYNIQSEIITYDQKKNTISSNDTSILKDIDGNKYLVDDFNYDMNNDIIKVNNIISEDINKNKLKASIAYINTNSKKIFGKDVELYLYNQSNIDNNKFRLKGNSVKIDRNISEITKGIFTTCRARKGCPPWQLSSKKIEHNKKKRQITYEDATLKLYDFPIAYFPKFFHPDPTVKRQSGFLTPAIKDTSNTGVSLNLPYFYTLSDNKDFTFTPRLYLDDKFLFQTEYRQKNKNTKHVADFSFLSEKKASSKNHLFYEYDREKIFKNFNKSDLKFKFQKISSDNYLKKNKLSGEIVNEADVLENSLNLNLYSNDLSINLASAAYEDVNKTGNDKFEYILPKLLVKKNFLDLGNKLNGKLSLESDSLIRQFDTNKEQKLNINNISFALNPNINKFGFYNNHKFIIRNSNSENDETNYKNDKNFYLSGIYQFNSNFPLIKNDKKFQKILKPRISFKASPSHTKDERNVDRKIDITNIYSIDRATENSSVEGGMSATYGIDYSISEKQNSKQLLNLKVANNIRLKKNNDLVNGNQIGEKMSNIFSEVEYKPNKYFTTKYISSFKNNFEDISDENLITNLNINNFITTFDYLNENNTKEKNSYISNTTQYLIDESNTLSFSTRKNNTKDLTEYYKFMYQYKNDCLAASVEYNKDFYSDQDLKPSESIFFRLTIKPFGGSASPNLKR